MSRHCRGGASQEERLSPGISARDSVVLILVKEVLGRTCRYNWRANAPQKTEHPCTAGGSELPPSLLSLRDAQEAVVSAGLAVPRARLAVPSWPAAQRRAPASCKANLAAGPRLCRGCSA